jgi:hypothetical protein
MDPTDVSIPAPPAAPGTLPAAPSPATPIQSSAVAGGDQCANCGAQLAADQRYCLQCGQRRGDPRLPFMDAVVLMDAVQRPRQAPPPPPKKKRSGISPNAALITGIGVLLLALGIGVLIGRSGNNTTASAPQTPQVITVNGGGGGGGTSTGSSEGSSASKGATTTGGSKGKAPKSKQEKAKALAESEKHPASEEVLKPASGIKLAPPKVKPGGKCESGSAGCKGGKFTGEFFGE